MKTMLSLCVLGIVAFSLFQTGCSSTGSGGREINRSNDDPLPSAVRRHLERQRRSSLDQAVIDQFRSYAFHKAHRGLTRG
ncbi:MAG: hypothetical protein AAF236_15265 [Verrucomicrobiota bacterium]